MDDKNLILSLRHEDDGHIVMSVTRDGKDLANGIYSLLTMCKDELGEDGETIIGAFAIGIGEFLEDLPVDESMTHIEFLTQCIAEAQDKKKKVRDCDC